MAEKLSSTISVIGIDIGKNSFHLVGLDERGAIVLRQRSDMAQCLRRTVRQKGVDAPDKIVSRCLVQTRKDGVHGRLVPRLAAISAFGRSAEKKYPRTPT